MINLAPIILFVYNRPWHTQQTLEALMANELANQSKLYIYADGAKSNASPEQKEKIDLVRSVIRSKQWCKEVIIVEFETNRGLANSIINGVTEVVDRDGKIIVLEDDLVTSKDFLSFMNDALEMYKDEKQVAGISGFSFIKSPDLSFFLRNGCCWGWATWKRVWNETTFDIDHLIGSFDDRIKKAFDVENSYPYFEMLLNQKHKKIDSWAIRFYASYFLKEQLFLYPQKSMVNNIGFDEGTHHNSDIKEANIIASTFSINSKIKKIAIMEKNSDRKMLIKQLKNLHSPSIFDKIYRKAFNLF